MIQPEATAGERSLPVRERGLKRSGKRDSNPRKWSLPVRERGLKPLPYGNLSSQIKSLPVRERGLKRGYHGGKHQEEYVAPRAGAWIET